MKTLFFKINKIFRLLGRFFFYFPKKALIKNKNFTIFSNNCIGGCIYHSLGKPFLSPTINCYIKTDEFINFLLDYDKYLSKELVFIKSEYDFPVARLYDITIYFNHYKTESEVLSAWNRRKKRINKSNMFAIIREIDGEVKLTDDVIDKLLSIYKNFVIITFNKEKKNLKFYKYINLKNHNDEFYKNFYKIDLWERKWNYVSFLNDKCFKRKKYERLSKSVA